MALVYAHLKGDTKEVFYIGIGSTEKRAHWRYQRSKIWNNTIKKHGYTITILANNISWDSACELEKFLIAFYGRQDLKTGPLVNMTDGGDGSPNIVVSEETRKKQSAAWKFRTPTRIGAVISEETRKRISEGNKGKKISPECIEKMRLAKAGKNYPPPCWERSKLKRGSEKSANH